MCQLTYLILSSQLTYLLYYIINETTQNFLNANEICWRRWPIVVSRAEGDTNYAVAIVAIRA